MSHRSGIATTPGWNAEVQIRAHNLGNKACQTLLFETSKCQIAMSDTLYCPNCGREFAPLRSSQAWLRCPTCGTSTVNPYALQRTPSLFEYFTANFGNMLVLASAVAGLAVAAEMV